MSFTHFDAKGRAVMVDVSGKEPTLRVATAGATVNMKPKTVATILEGKAAKGDVLAVARLAGIAAAKKTPELIPLSHPLALQAVSVEFDPDPETGLIHVKASVKAFDRTGVEMEAMAAASIAALTIYDMCKSMDRGITIREVALLHKEGGKSGTYRRKGSR
ncbi:MAG TPA: cyclic pyranopterin monophosphate synthase MoaC [Candidatus Limnocylindria bacterium]|nr:cyclic pyranopterin monophosphate synthase MoaC [Candidatus Limnocylindria bacterium]